MKPSSSSLRHFGNNAFLYGAGNSVMRGASFLLVPIYAHSLSVSEYGTLEIALLTIQIVGVFMAVGMPSAIIRFYSKAAKDNDAGRLLGSSFGIIVIAMLVCSSLVLLLPSFVLSKVLGVQKPSILIILIAITALSECWTFTAMSTLRAQDKGGKFTLTAICNAFFLLLFTLFFLPLFHQGLRGALMARGLAYGSIGLVISYPLLRFNSLSFSMKKARAVFRFGFPLTFSACGWFILVSSDRYFLAYFSGMHQVGIYSLGYRITLLLLVLVVFPFELTYGPFVFANMDNHEIRKMMSRLLTYLLLALIVVDYLIMLFSRDIINLVAPKGYADAYLVTIYLLPATTSQGIHYWSNAQLNIRQKTSYIALVIGVAALLNIGLDYLLIPRYGLMGAVVATNISTLLAVGTLVIIGFFLFPVPLELRRLGTVVGVGVALCFSYLMTHTLTSYYFYLSNSAVLLAIPIFLYYMRFFDVNEKHFLISLLAFKGLQR